MHCSPSMSYNKDLLTYLLNSTLHLSGVAKLSTSFGCGKGAKVTVTQCDPIWYVISCSCEVISTYLIYLLTYLLTSIDHTQFQCDSYLRHNILTDSVVPGRLHILRSIYGHNGHSILAVI